ncbi:MAG: hypothetical protein KF850_37305 [Labilithrix sp.]|nr:hypothetical protein [Labilithrix sp.]
MTRSEKSSTADAVVIGASCRAEKLAVGAAPRARVAFDGEGDVETHRTGIPTTGTEDGQEYRNVSVEVSIRGRLRQIHRAPRNR